MWKVIVLLLLCSNASAQQWVDPNTGFIYGQSQEEREIKKVRELLEKQEKERKAAERYEEYRRRVETKCPRGR
jgi:hypothetical protein